MTTHLDHLPEPRMLCSLSPGEKHVTRNQIKQKTTNPSTKCMDTLENNAWKFTVKQSSKNWVTQNSGYHTLKHLSIPSSKQSIQNQQVFINNG